MNVTLESVKTEHDKEVRIAAIKDCAKLLNGKIAFNFIHDHTGYSNAAEELSLWANQLRAKKIK